MHVDVLPVDIKAVCIKRSDISFMRKRKELVAVLVIDSCADVRKSYLCDKPIDANLIILQGRRRRQEDRQLVIVGECR